MNNSSQKEVYTIYYTLTKIAGHFVAGFYLQLLVSLQPGPTEFRWSEGSSAIGVHGRGFHNFL